YDDGVNPPGYLNGIQFSILGQGLAGPGSESIGAVRCRPGPATGCGPIFRKLGMDSNVLCRLVGILIGQVIGQVLVNCEPQLLTLNGNILCLDGGVISTDNQRIDPGGSLCSKPAVLPFGHGNT